MSNSANSSKKVNYKLLLRRLLVCFLFVYLLVKLIVQQFQFAALKKQHAEVDLLMEEAMREQEHLNAEFESIDSEDFIRRVIREKFGYTRPNEKVFVDASK